MSETEKTVIRLIDKYAEHKQQKYLPDMLLTDLGYTSFTFVCLIMELEELFDITFEDDVLIMQEAKVRTLTDYVAERANNNG